MIKRFLLLSAFVLFSSTIVDTPEAWPPRMIRRALSAILGSRHRSDAQRRHGRGQAGAVPAAVPSVFRRGSLRPFALGTYWRTATALQREDFVGLYEDYLVASYSTALRALGGASFEVLGSHSDREGVIVSSRVQINGGGAPIRIDWRLNPINHGYKVTNVIVNGISTASTQHSDLISFIQRHNGDVPSFLVALREKNASNGMLR